MPGPSGTSSIAAPSDPWTGHHCGHEVQPVCMAVQFYFLSFRVCVFSSWILSRILSRKQKTPFLISETMFGGDGGIRTTGRFFEMWLFELIGALFTNYFTGTKAFFDVFFVPAGTKMAHENSQSNYFTNGR